MEECARGLLDSLNRVLGHHKYQETGTEGKSLGRLIPIIAAPSMESCCSQLLCCRPVQFFSPWNCADYPGTEGSDQEKHLDWKGLGFSKLVSVRGFVVKL